jgi:hypothetical protein
MADNALTEIKASDDERTQLRSFLSIFGSLPQDIEICVKDLEFPLPRPLIQAIFSVAITLSEGNTVAVVSEEAEVSPAQAANLLGVSRQYVDRLLANDVLPSRRLPDSSYRKIPVRSVLEHKRIKERKRAGLSKIAEDAAAAGLPN